MLGLAEVELIGTVQVYIPKFVAAAADIEHLSERLAARGVAFARFERSTFRAQGRVRVTCKTRMAQTMLEDIRAAHDWATTFALHEACGAAVRAVEDSIAEAYTGGRQPHDGRSDSERGLLWQPTRRSTTSGLPIKSPFCARIGTANVSSSLFAGG